MARYCKCGAVLKSKRSDAQYCSPRCRKQESRQRYNGVTDKSNCDKAIIEDIRNLTPEMFCGIRFGVIVADPPWAYEHNHTQGGVGDGQHYNTLTIDDLCTIPVSQIAAKDSVLFLWATFPKLAEAMQLIPAWGFEYVTGFPWLKTDKSGKPNYGVGHWARGCAELILIGRRGKAKAPRKKGWLGLISPSMEHSKKPDSIHDYAESLSGPYLELFARRQRHGWVCFGNEMQYTLF